MIILMLISSFQPLYTLYAPPKFMSYYFFINYYIQMVLPISAWVWGLAQKYGNLMSGHFNFSLSQQISITNISSVEPGLSTPSMLVIWLGVSS